jgi:transposase-like protein
VETDETYVGARNKSGTKRGRPGPDSHKTSVVALVERGSGRVRALTMPRVTGENLKEAITANVHPKARMMTDEFSAYRVVAEQTGREHHSVKHSRVEFVRGDVHSNMAEGLNSGFEGVA